MDHLRIKTGWDTLRVFPALFLCIGLAGCNWIDWLKPASRTRLEETNRTAEPNSTKMMSQGEKLAFHRWLVLEMQEQIFARPVKDMKAASAWANVLSQRASIEGVYHGLILSTEYVALEKGRASDIKALRFFGNEMAMLDFPAAVESDPQVMAAAARYVKDSLGWTIYTLKRELGERILREAEKRKGNSEKLAAWYAGIAARWARQEINFGLPQRNSKDEVFHFNWAKENTLGMIQWELLNKAHRILNNLGGIAVSPTGK